jgi:hypothetical protein
LKRVVTGRLKEFDVSLENRPGSLADLCDMMAQAAVNIKAIATNGGHSARLVTSDETTTREVLTKARLPWSEADVLQIRLTDRPGELAKISRMLAKEKINVDSVYLLGATGEWTDLVLKVSDTANAMKVLSR